MLVASIGIGSNSLRMLVADVVDGKLIRLKRSREGLRVFAALDENGNILEEMIQRTCDSVEQFRKNAVEMGAQIVHLFATSAVRDAKNQHVLEEALYQKTGLSLEVISGEDEARMSFWGVSEPNITTGLIDIGGGSTEIAIGKEKVVYFAHSFQVGAVRLFRKYPIENYEQSMQVVNATKEVLLYEKRHFQVTAIDKWIGVGGTFTTLAALAQDISWEDKSHIHNFPLTYENVKKVLENLSGMKLEDRLCLQGLQPQRADIVVHGIAILLACMSELNIPVINVSEYGNLEGYLKEKYLF